MKLLAYIVPSVSHDFCYVSLMIIYTFLFERSYSMQSIFLYHLYNENVQGPAFLNYVHM
jgi:hypothetical protein